VKFFAALDVRCFAGFETQKMPYAVEEAFEKHSRVE
jgi:hypothetical protein